MKNDRLNDDSFRAWKLHDRVRHASRIEELRNSGIEELGPKAQYMRS
jgi:hypothetical protein